MGISPIQATGTAPSPKGAWTAAQRTARGEPCAPPHRIPGNQAASNPERYGHGKGDQYGYADAGWRHRQ